MNGDAKSNLPNYASRDSPPCSSPPSARHPRPPAPIDPPPIPTSPQPPPARRTPSPPPSTHARPPGSPFARQRQFTADAKLRTPSASSTWKPPTPAPPDEYRALQPRTRA
ncbi:MAG: hypothetical protein U0841_29110 [Chloroflexia bacterium]